MRNYVLCFSMGIFICYFSSELLNELLNSLLSLFGTSEGNSGPIVTTDNNYWKVIGEGVTVIFIVCCSFELSAKYLGLRIFNKRIKDKDRV